MSHNFVILFRIKSHFYPPLYNSRKYKYTNRDERCTIANPGFLPSPLPPFFFNYDFYQLSTQPGANDHKPREKITKDFLFLLTSIVKRCVTSKPAIGRGKKRHCHYPYITLASFSNPSKTVIFYSARDNRGDLLGLNFRLQFCGDIFWGEQCSGEINHSLGAGKFIRRVFGQD